MGSFHPVHHVAITVTDVDRSREWYRRLFGMDPVLDEDLGPFWHVVWMLPNGIGFALHHHPSTRREDRFSEFVPGMDHLSFGCASREELEGWRDRLDEMGIQHGGIVENPNGSADLSFRDPDNVALEFFLDPPPA